MGCSPSKGKLFSKPEALGLQKDLLAEKPQATLDCRPEEVEKACCKTEEKGDKLLTEELHTKKTASCEIGNDTTVAQNTDNIKETEVNLMPEEIDNDLLHRDKIKTETQKKKKIKKQSSEKQRKPSIAQTKMDLLPHVLKAHQAAYNFLNPNISKYETLLGLLDHAAQAQMSLQPMMCALVLHFEEINQALEEMAEEGELMLKEHGDHITLPFGMIGQAVRSAKPSSDTGSPLDQSSDILQQLVQHSAEKMKLLGGSVQALGDKTIEETLVCFSSLSEQLVEKMQAKQTAERRLAQILAKVERAAMRKSNPEDSALHSEDSGIGGESESLTGSERHRRVRGNAKSGSCGSGVHIQGVLNNLHNNLANSVDPNEVDGEEEDDDDQDEREYEDDEHDCPERKRSSSSPPDPSQALRSMQFTVQRPLTAIKPEYSSSTRCVNVMTELKKSKNDLDQRMKNMSKIQKLKAVAITYYNLNGAAQRRHSLNELGDAYQSPMRKKPLVSKPTKPHSVRRLINSFSQGVDGRQGQSLVSISYHVRRPNKSHVPQSDTVNTNEEALVISDNNNSWPDSRDDLDVDNLPPPPPEVLLDNSFQSNEGQLGNEHKLQEVSICRPVINKRTGISQRLKIEMQKEVLPNRATMRTRSIPTSHAHNVSQEAVVGAQNGKLQRETALDQEAETANCLYQEARKVIHLHNGVESPDKKYTVEPSCLKSSSLQARMGQGCENNELCESKMSSCSMPVTAPPVSRVRLPPSCPALCNRYPSPPAFRPQYTSRPSSRPSSPKARKCSTDNTAEEIIPSVSFQDARSFFRRSEMQNSQACLSFGSSVLPRQWGEATRGRLPSRVIDSSTRRTQSEQRPFVTSKSEFEMGVSLPSISAKGSEPAVTK